MCCQIYYLNYLDQSKLAPKKDSGLLLEDPTVTKVNLLDKQYTSLTSEDLTVKRVKTFRNLSTLYRSESKSAVKSALRMSRESSQVTVTEIKVE
jgi:hypothetical protein